MKSLVLQSLTCNFRAKALRYETLEGRSHLVVPTVMITEGVHRGSQGPLFYPSKELKRNISGWNHKPIVVYHPEIRGRGISACDPDVINTQKVGVILNVQWHDKLRCESWLDVERLKEVDYRVLDALLRNQKVEVSTGLWTKNKRGRGVFNGKEYDWTATSYEPDHLAILPDKKGACSIEDGAGLLQLNQAGLDRYIRKHINRRPARVRIQNEDGHWVTLRGSPVYIEDGQITRGPKHLVGKSSEEATKSHQGDSNEGYDDYKKHRDGGSTHTQARLKVERAGGKISDHHASKYEADRASRDADHTAAELKALKERSMKKSATRNTKDDGVIGKWVTIRGTPVLIDKGGVILSGPKHMKGMKLKPKAPLKVAKEPKGGSAAAERKRQAVMEDKALKQDNFIDAQDEYITLRDKGLTHKQSVSKLFSGAAKKYPALYTHEIIRAARGWKEEFREFKDGYITNPPKLRKTNNHSKEESMKTLKKGGKAKPAQKPARTPVIVDNDDLEFDEMSRDDQVDYLIANHDWEEEDRDFLTDLSDKKFDPLFNSSVENYGDSCEDMDDDEEEEPAPVKKGKKKAAPPAMNRKGKGKKSKVVRNEEDEDEDGDDDDAIDDEPVNNRSMSVEDYIDNAPAPVRDLLQNALTMQNNARRTLIKQIVSNRRNKFTKAYLGERTMDELQGIASLAGVNNTQGQRVPVLYTGAAGPVDNQYDGGRPTETLSTPVMNYSDPDDDDDDDDDDSDDE